MDIQYLLLLQNFREATGGVFDSFFFFMSELSVNVVFLLLPSLIFWCISKQAGAYLFFNYGIGYTINQAVKNTACIYRPWVRDARVVPVDKAFATATGYSFPSGHTQIAWAQYGGLAVWFRKKKLVLVGGLLVVLLIGFSRNYLGVHTPQDVIVSSLLSMVVLFINYRVLNWVEKNPKKDVIVAAAGCALAIIMLVYVSVKSYPMTYGADGELLVDPQKMILDCYSAAGSAIGVMISWLIERRVIQFQVEGSVRRRILRFVIGAAGCILVYKASSYWCLQLLGAAWGRFFAWVLMFAYSIMIYPFFIKLVQNREK